MRPMSLATRPNVRPADGTEIRLSLIEGFGLWTGREPVRLPMSAQRLVAYAALQGRPVLRPHVAASLWLDTPEERALANLRTALWRLRRPGPTIIEVGGDQLWLSPRVRVDYVELTDLARSMLATSSAVEPASAERLTLAGEILPGWFDEWVFLQRERFRHLRLHALERACRVLAQMGDYGRAIDAGLAAVAEEPLRESAHLGLIEAHLAEGNRVEALRQFGTYRRLMRDELGLPPSARMVAVIQDVAAAGGRMRRAIAAAGASRTGGKAAPGAAGSPAAASGGSRSDGSRADASRAEGGSRES
jgi:DNA-binding SARP family transcriptional activator